jgi:hypothetical protein
MTFDNHKTLFSKTWHREAANAPSLPVDVQGINITASFFQRENVWASAR